MSRIDELEAHVEKLSTAAKNAVAALKQREDVLLQDISDLEEKVIELEDALQEKEYNETIAQRETYRSAYCEGYGDAIQTLEYLIENEKAAAADVAYAKMYAHYHLKLEMWKIGSDDKDSGPPAFKQIVLT